MSTIQGTTINDFENNKLFQKLLEIAIPPQLCVSDSGQILMENLTWRNIFDHVKSEHWHQCGKFTCPHDESLYCHLLSCSDVCYNKAMELNYPPKKCIKLYMTGLLHDIGKMGCRRCVGNHTAFKGHGLIGGAILENLYSPTLFDAFGLTKEDWGDISTCADVHMCSYFSQQTTAIHKYSVNILPLPCKEMLRVLRYGDQLGMIPSKSLGKTVEEIQIDVIKRENSYVATLFDEIPFASMDKKKGVLIFIQGGSSVGKSSFARKLVGLIGIDMSVHINRDYYMVHWAQKMNGIKERVAMEDITPSLYQKCHKIYTDANKRWAPQMNNHMMRDIYEGLQQGKIVIVDTMATMFDSIETIIPKIAIDAYRISFWLHRNIMITEEESKGRLGMELSVQVKAHGETTLYNPFNKSINWTSMISSTETALNEGDDSPYRSHLAISVGWTSIKDHIITHLAEKIRSMYHYNQSIMRVPILEQTNDLTLIQLVQKLKDMNAIEEFFSQYAYSLSKHIPGVVGIKYIDGMNQIWRPKWAREARGRFYYIGGDFVIPLKDTLQRGIEILTKVHIDAGINETQDVSMTNNKMDDTQMMILRKFSGENPLDSYLTGKVDGSLLIVNIYPIECVQYNEIKRIGLTHGDTFTQTIIRHCIDNNHPIVTISTQGTLFIGIDMQDYFLTAIQPLIGMSIDSVESWSTIVPYFVAKILDYYSMIGLDNKMMVNICFEAYCKNRTTIIGKLHTELAIGYDHSGINLLGLMNQGKYIPHFILPRAIFTQPFYIRIKNTIDVYRLMKELDEVVLGIRTTDMFLSNFTLDEFTSRVIHPEGFVLLTPLADGTFDYEKIKTELYYACHNVRQGKIKELLLLPKSCSLYYPILNNLHTFFDNINESVQSLVQSSYNSLINQINKESPFYQKQNPKGQLRMNMVIDSDIDSLDIKNIEVVCKMMLNCKANSTDLIDILTPITIELYKNSTEDLILFTKSLLMKVEPWKPEWETRLMIMFSNFDEAVNSLYGIVVGFH